MTAYPHLSPEAASWMKRDDETRAQSIVDSRPTWFVEYPGLAPIKRTVMRTLRAKPSTRGRHILLYGHSHAGKSQLIRNCVTQFRAERGIGATSTVLPLECTSKMDEMKFYEQLINKTGAPSLRATAVAPKRTQGLTVLQNLSVCVVVLDELNTLTLTSYLRQKEFLAFMKYLTNSEEHRITFICAGTHAARSALYADREMSTRFREVHVGPVENGDDFQGVLAALERDIPLARASNLKHPSLAGLLNEMSEGLVGEVAQLLEDAALRAIDDGDEQVTQDVLARLDWTLPSQRRADTSHGS
ncbi:MULTISPECIES: TniB family NTP-binding protein [Sphingomonas]|jgi:ATP:corrinoid adenosyltransferase|uniref:AAA+ ATPase domain-containing protein n=2 Tax=Sphingomonas TaxID=13687 RepID=A0A2A4I1I6_9SPHN|nr:MULTISPECIES: TniB family NTP-binding protein [Sphingomonas]NJC35323.1 ATP:corrinoid adenosyltransferase [Sphingomonas jejuensis]PCG09777.1 hypothetical protein COA17_08015 [Sphingomonas ginsenosidimutans]